MELDHKKYEIINEQNDQEKYPDIIKHKEYVKVLLYYDPGHKELE